MGFLSSLNNWVATYQILIASVLIPLITVFASFWASKYSYKAAQAAMQNQILLRRAEIQEKRINQIQAATSRLSAALAQIHTLSAEYEHTKERKPIEDARTMQASLPDMIANLLLHFDYDTEVAKRIGEIVKDDLLASNSPPSPKRDKSLMAYLSPILKSERDKLDQILIGKA